MGKRRAREKCIQCFFMLLFWGVVVVSERPPPSGVDDLKESVFVCVCVCL